MEIEVFELGFDTLKHLGALILSARRQGSFDISRAEEFGDVHECCFRKESEPEVVILSVANGFIVFPGLFDEVRLEDDAAVSERILPEDGLSDFGICYRWSNSAFVFR